MSSQINGQTGLASDLYSQRMRQAYAAGDYASALYARGVRERLRQQAVPGLNSSQLSGATSANIRNARRNWPSQVAAQAEFYLNEANASRNASAAADCLQQAYSTSVLASGLASADARLSGSFIPSIGRHILGAVLQKLDGLQQSVNPLQQELAEVYAVLLVVVVLVFALLAALLVMLLKPKKRTRKPGRRREGEP